MATETTGAQTIGAGTSPIRQRAGGERGGRGARGGGGRGRGATGTSADGAGSAGQNGERQGQRKRRSGRSGNRGAISSTSDRPSSNGNTMNASDLAERFSSSQHTAKDGQAGAGNAEKVVATTVGGGAAEDEAEPCWICASPIVHESVAPCNHRTCHICALRMRGLYKDLNCATCRVSFTSTTSHFIASSNFT